MAPATRPQKDEMVREPGAPSSRVSHFGHSISLEYATARAAGISALQCGQMRTATRHPSVGTPNNKRMGRQRKEKASPIQPQGHGIPCPYPIKLGGQAMINLGPGGNVCIQARSYATRFWPMANGWRDLL